MSKSYDTFKSPLRRLSSLLVGDKRSGARRHVVFEDVNFDVYPGEAFGIIGRNGSGKSTLLQCICGTLEPTAGEVVVRGKIGALLELGAGFSPDFSGRENIRISGALMGMSAQEVAARMDDILAFADIGEYVDQPVKTYSSGMFVRLAFSVMAHSSPEVLIVDEALAVGDVFFTQKCMRFIRGFIDNGGALLFVSHDTASVVNLCRRGLMLFPNFTHRPVVGPAEELCKDYLARVYEDPARQMSVAIQRSMLASPEALTDALVDAQVIHGDQPRKCLLRFSDFNPLGESFGESAARIVDVHIQDGSGERIHSAEGGEVISLVLEAEVRQDIVHPAFGFMLKDRHGQYIITEGTDATFRSKVAAFRAGSRVSALFTFIAPVLAAGEYTINVAMAEGMGDEHVQQHWIHDALRIECVDSPVVHGVMGPSGSGMTLIVNRPGLARDDS